jgi:hypothetical protein
MQAQGTLSRQSNRAKGMLGLQALLKVNIRLATTDYLSNGYDGL